MINSDYQPQSFENKWIEYWKRKKYFAAKIDSSSKSFVMIHPAPNITGNLHIGHALNIILQDVLMRCYRLKGYNTVWFPGTDHGGIATQNVIENQLRTENKTRTELGKKAFIDIVWQWKNEIISIMRKQMLAIGAVPDFGNEYFTMDEIRTNGVKEAFVRLYNKGFIYKEDGIVNWCPRCETALSEMELEIRQEKQTFYLIKYKLKGIDKYIPVMTMRPETIRADVAIAVNSNDVRYKYLIGNIVITPIFGSEIPVLAESYVSSTFGEGAVRVTPGHVPNDFILAKKYGLPIINVMEQNGIIEDVDDKAMRMDRFIYRNMMIDKLKKEDMLIRTEEHLHGSGYCYRCKTLVEPYPLEQWYLKIDEMMDTAIQLVETGEIDIRPVSYKKVICDWMKNLKKRKLQRENWWEGSCVAVQMGFSSNKDWCISRQIWWGHEIPAWKCDSCKRFTVSAETPEICYYCGNAILVQEEDVLDMWFSCALWPLNVMGWPENTTYMTNFFPQNLAVTGYDVIYFWIVPTIMLVYELSGKKPYDRLLLHGLVCDREGKKMSKSFGNVINPNDIINKYGSDTLRLTLVSKVSKDSKDIKISEDDFIKNHRKIKKIWRYAHELENITHQYGAFILKDNNIINKSDEVFEELEQQVTSYIEDYDFKNAVELIFSNLLQEIEEKLLFIKKHFQIDDHGLETILKELIITKKLFKKILFMLHPFIPFVTEELWEKFNYGDKSLLETEWPINTSVYTS